MGLTCVDIHGPEGGREPAETDPVREEWEVSFGGVVRGQARRTGTGEEYRAPERPSTLVQCAPVSVDSGGSPTTVLTGGCPSRDLRRVLLSSKKSRT